jgi:hypothetical protein
MNGAQNLTEPVAAQADGSLSNRRDWKYFDQRLTELRVNDVENIIGRGQVLIEAHDELERGSYEATVKRHFDLSYARKLRIIAVHPVLSNRSHANALPPHPETLYQLSRLPEDVLRAKLKDGSINPKLERKDVASWRKRKDGEVTVDGKTIERKLSLSEKLKAADAKNKTLTEKLTRKDDGSLFDLKNDSVKEIAEAIAANLSEAKAAALAKAIPEAIKELKRKRQKPAG